MEILIGFGVAVLVCAFAALSGFDRDRAFYPTVVIVVAHYYILFAAMADSAALIVELLAASVFIVIAVAGFKKNLLWAAIGLAGHGVFDFVHHLIIQNAGVPVWWPGFCAGFDIVAGVVAAVLLRRRYRVA